MEERLDHRTEPTRHPDILQSHGPLPLPLSVVGILGIFLPVDLGRLPQRGLQSFADILLLLGDAGDRGGCCCRVLTDQPSVLQGEGDGSLEIILALVVIRQINNFRLLRTGGWRWKAGVAGHRCCGGGGGGESSQSFSYQCYDVSD